MGRAYLSTLTASRALGVVNDREVVNHLDCALGAVKLALLTADASILASLACYSTLVLGGAHNSYLCIDRQELDYVLGAFLDTHSAADAGSWINMSNTVYNADCVGRTYACTVAAAYTAEAAGVRSCKNHRCRLAGSDAVIVSLLGSVLKVAVTAYKCNHRLTDLDLNTKKVGKLVCCRLTAGHAEVCLTFAQSKCLCIAVTACISAGTAVSTGQALSDILGELLLLNSEKVSRNYQKNCTDKSQTAYYQKSK